MEKIFILEPRYGLCNQLSCIALGIVLGIMYNRSIYYNGFQLDYKNEEEIIDFSKIIDVDKLKLFIHQKGFHVNILEKINIEQKKKEKNLYYQGNLIISDIKDIYTLLELKENKNVEVLNIKNPISTFIQPTMKSLYEEIKLNINFHSQFLKLATTIKQHFNLENYCCIHLRMEDDAIDFMIRLLKKNNFELINDIYKEVYLNEINKIISLGINNIYICTSLCLYENKNNLFYEIIKKKYNLFDKHDILNEIKFEDINPQLNKREIFGIIDYIIAQDSVYFVGCDWSSFSLALKNYHDSKNKSCNLLNIWKICKNAFQYNNL